MVAKTATCVPFEDSKVQQFFEKLHNVPTFSEFEIKKVGPLVEKIFSGFLKQHIALSEE